MIKNKPDSQEFKNLSVQYLAQSIDHILKTEIAISYHGDWAGDDFDEEWESRQGILGNSLIMLFLAMENYIKYKICLVNPLLLLSGEPSKWGAAGEDKNFEDIYIHQFDDLLVIYQEITSTKLPPSINAQFQDLRSKRNKYTHGLHREFLVPNYILQSLVAFLSGIWDSSWIKDFKSVMIAERLYGMFDGEEEDIQLMQYFVLFEKYLTNKEFCSLIGMPVEGRRYLCPFCSDNLVETGTALLEANYAKLTPNDPSSTEVTCWVCGHETEIERRDCCQSDCKGNVIFTGETTYNHFSSTCLTCGNEQQS